MPFSQFMLVRRSTQPAAVYIARLTATATAAYVLALYLPAGSSRPVLAPLTAMLVLQASLYQTIRTGFRKVIAAVAGVFAAVAISGYVPFTWWVLGLLTAGTLIIGHVLRLGLESLDVPTGAILMFSTTAGAAGAAGTPAAATGRIIDTVAGVAAGLAGGLLFAPLRTQTARDAVGDFADQLASILDRMTGDLSDDPDPDQVGVWLDQARALQGEIQRVDETLRQAEDSTKLNPRVFGGDSLPPETAVALRGGLETLEHAALSLRFLARSVTDATRFSGDASPVRDADTRAHLAAVLTMLAAAVRTYGRLVRTLPYGSEALKSALSAELEAARQLQDRLASLLEPRNRADGGYSEWPVRGEILCHVDRLRAGLTVGIATQVRTRRARPKPKPKVRIASRVRPTPVTGTVRPARTVGPRPRPAHREDVARQKAIRRETDAVRRETDTLRREEHPTRRTGELTPV